MENLKEVKQSSWDEIFSIWKREEDQPDNHWRAHWQSQGFKSWTQWRQATHKALQPELLNWNVYEILDPARTISSFKGGPFNGWTKWFYMGEPSPTFEKIVQHPGIQNHYFILNIANNFPSSTTLIGVKNENGIYIVEGMHRACAAALRHMWNRPITSKIYLALADYEGELPALGIKK